ncbi:FH1/FH2 domain-containing protein 1-like [Cyprinus carpio]|uniref:FH1/FH2 domain-containing protein 1-like n=1 Tax=Cyprinus carpio TaxID=7962 RepID=A0A9Q9WFV1_CYPCA|nr:FH1/FH2 domain-containing protein 1-like [Cyprinus carpio]
MRILSWTALIEDYLPKLSANQIAATPVPRASSPFGPAPFSVAFFARGGPLCRLQSIWAKVGGLEPVQLDTNRLDHTGFESKSSNSRGPSQSDGGPPHDRGCRRLVPTEEELNKSEKGGESSVPADPSGPAEPVSPDPGQRSSSACQTAALGPSLWTTTHWRDFAYASKQKSQSPLFHLKLAMEQLAATSDVFAAYLQLSLPTNPLICTTDITAVTKASKCDYTQVQLNLSQLESLCKACWDQLRLLEKDGKKKKCGGRKEEAGEEAALHQRLTQFLKDCEERLKVLRAVHRRVINRFHSFLLFLGYSRTMVRETSAEVFCKTVSDFALEYRATRTAVLQQKEREKEKHSRNTPKLKTRLQQSPSDENQEQVKLEEVLKTPESSSSSPFPFDFTLPRQRSKTSDKKGCPSRKLKW